MDILQKKKEKKYRHILMENNKRGDRRVEPIEGIVEFVVWIVKSFSLSSPLQINIRRISNTCLKIKKEDFPVL